MRKALFRSILLRYIVSYAVVMVVIFIGVGIYVNNNFTSAIRASIVEENTNRLSALRIQHEEKLTTLLSIGSQIGLSNYISPFRMEDDLLKAYHLKEQLASYNSTNDFFSQMYIIYHEDDYLYSANTSVSLEMFSETLMRYESVSPERIRALLRNQNDSISILPSINIKSTLTNNINMRLATVIVPLRLDGRFSIGNVLFLIDDNSYQRMFTDEIYQMRNMYIFREQEILSAVRRIGISDEIIRDKVFGPDEDLIQELITEDGVKYLLFVQEGSMLGMRYVSLIPQETVKMQTTRSQVAFALFMLLLSIPCGLLTVYFSRKHVRPIRELQQSFGGNSAAEDGFTAIRSGIESLIGQNKALNTRLDESMEAFKAEFVKNFVKGKYTVREEVVNTGINLGLSTDRAFFCVSLMAAVSQESNGLERLYALMGEDETVSGYSMEIIDQEQYLFALFADKREALEAWADAAKLVLLSLDKEAVIAVSDIHTDFAEATAAYLEASAAYDNRFVMGNENVLWFSDVTAAAKEIEPFSRGYLDGFRTALHAGDTRALNDRINELFQGLREKKFSLFAFRIVYNDIISILLNKYLSYEGVSRDTLQYYDIFELSRCRQVEDLVDTLRRLCSDILSRNEISGPEEYSVIPQVNDFMRENYTNPDLTMGFIAEKYGISASRLSLEYREMTGMYPSEYLLLLRMEKAKELLTETDMSIQEVGAEVGYYDASGFIRRFKRHMSVTPAQYRQSVKNRSAEP